MSVQIMLECIKTAGTFWEPEYQLSSFFYVETIKEFPLIWKNQLKDCMEHCKKWVWKWYCVIPLSGPNAIIYSFCSV